MGVASLGIAVFYRARVRACACAHTRDVTNHLVIMTLASGTASWAVLRASLPALMVT